MEIIATAHHPRCQHAKRGHRAHIIGFIAGVVGTTSVRSVEFKAEVGEGEETGAHIETRSRT